MSLREKAIQSIELPPGRVVVDLVDADSGKIVQREEGENFIAQDMTRFLKWSQRAFFGMYNPTDVISSDGMSPRRYEFFPMYHLAYWNDSSAEDSVNEHRVGAPVVGFASRFPQGSPTGLRGVVNITESEFSDAHAKWVFDWLTSCGNGTFQSVGWTKMDLASGCPAARLFDDANKLIISDFNRYTSGSQTYPFFGDGTNWWILDRVTASSGSQYRLSKYNSSGASRTTEFNISTGDFSEGMIGGLVRLGTDFYMAGGTTAFGSSSIKPRVKKFNSSGTLQYTQDESSDATANTSYYNDITSDGTNLWVIRGDGTIYRLNAATGARTATLTVTGVTAGYGIAYDSGDGNLWINVAKGGQCIIKIDTSGNIVSSPQFALHNAIDSGTATTPYIGGFNIANSRVRETTTQQFGTGQSVGNASTVLGTEVSYTNSVPTTFGSGCINYVSSSLWYFQAWTSGTLGLFPFTGHNLGSRVKLSSPVTKTSAQTLKITYEFDFS